MQQPSRRSGRDISEDVEPSENEPASAGGATPELLTPPHYDGEYEIDAGDSSGAEEPPPSSQSSGRKTTLSLLHVGTNVFD